MTPSKLTRDEAGFTLIDLLFVVALIGTVCTIALPTLLRARTSAQAASAIADMRVVNSAQLSYAITCGSGFYAPDLPTLGWLPPGSRHPFLSQDLTAAPAVIKSGYRIQMLGTGVAGAPPGCSGLGPGLGAPAYKAGADLMDAGNPIQRHFATNATGVIVEDTASLFAGMPEAGPPGVGTPIQ
jgi:hypothetical protein